MQHCHLPIFQDAVYIIHEELAAGMCQPPKTTVETKLLSTNNITLENQRFYFFSFKYSVLNVWLYKKLAAQFSVFKELKILPQPSSTQFMTDQLDVFVHRIR